MKYAHFYLVFFGLAFSALIFPQSWQQTAGTPQGSGVTDLLVKQSNGYIYVTTGSYNWPSEPGGVRVSTDQGTTWQNQTNSYVARTIIEAPDGNLYASIWPDPNLFAADGIYRTTNNGAVWTPLGFVQAGDNIFSIAVSPTTPVITIFAGTRNGVIRSTDNGSTFQNTSNGIPANSWVRDLEVKSNGTIYAATYSGLFKSSDNGDNWLLCQGIEPGDTVLKLCVYSSPNDAAEEQIMAGTQNNKMYEEGAELFVLAFAGTPVNLEVSGLDAFGPILLLGQFGNSNALGGIRTVYIEGTGWTSQPYNEGLPGNRPVSALAVAPTTRSESAKVFIGYFENTSTGAKVFYREFTTDVKEISSAIPDDFDLYQNYPNPFNPSTTIQFALPKESFTSVEVFNLLGEKVSTLVSETLSAGMYEYKWNAENLSSGVYFYKLTAGDFSQTKKLLLMK